MAQDISGFGLKVRIIASKSFPAGVTITQFADDADPLDIPSVNIGTATMGLNGDLIKASKANPIMATLNIIPDTNDDKNLGIIAENNRVGKGKTSVGDVINFVIMYPSGKSVTLTGGMITDAMYGNSVASAGRFKTKAYMFAFEQKVEA